MSEATGATADGGVRVRGVYATALTKYLLDKGYRIVHASKIVSERLGIPSDDSPADATVKSVEDDPDTILVVGVPRLFDRIYRDLLELLEYSLRYRSILQQYSTIEANVIEEGGACRAVAGGFVLDLTSSQCPSGKRVKVCVIHPPIYPWERGRGRVGVCLYKRYFVLNSWGEVSISRHIKQGERQEQILKLTTEALSRGVGVRWRSNAANIGLMELEKELQNAIEAFGKIKETITGRERELISEGRSLAVITLSQPDKLRLDEIRMSVTPTIRYHHTLKSGGKMLSEIADYAESLVNLNLDPKRLGYGAYMHTWRRLAGKKIFLMHKKLDGRTVRIGPATVERIEEKAGWMLLSRKIRSQGTYDGLDAPKESGDAAFTIIPMGKWHLIHIYIGREGGLKGVYININTPAEPGENMIRYIDLSIDVAYSNGEARIIDREELEKTYSMGAISEKTYKKALETAENMRLKIKTTLEKKEFQERIEAEKIIEALAQE